jgi:hypothetical protein
MALGLALAFLAACGSREPAPHGFATTTASTTTTSSSTSTSVPVTLPTTTTAPTANVNVAGLEQRLAALGYWPGNEDDVFDADTFHAVVAVQKAAGIPRDGVVGAATQRALDDGVRPAPRSTTGRVVEIDRSRQLLLVVEDGTLMTTFDTSTGSARHRTPIGHFRITRQIDALHRSPLGLLYRPKYFYKGIAMHGYTSVPAYPASHGCVRITYHAMDHVWATDLAPVGTPVWVY